jgi:nucleoside-diphosphate-sugar epimerase
MRANMLRLFDAVARGIPLPLGSVRNRRSLLYVGNATLVMRRILELGSEATGTFFVSDGEDLSTPDLVRAIGRALGRSARLFPVPSAVLRVALGSSIGQRLVGSLAIDSGPVWRTVGTTGRVSVHEGLTTTATWYRARNHGRHS